MISFLICFVVFHNGQPSTANYPVYAVYTSPQSKISSQIRLSIEKKKGQFPQGRLDHIFFKSQDFPIQRGRFIITIAKE